MHPSLEYGLVGVIAAAGTFVLTPLARLLAVLWGAVARPRDRDVHAVATPRLGGVAMFIGFGIAMLVAHTLPTLRDTFANGSEIGGVMLAGAMVCGLGALDDRFELDSLTKLAGQVAAAGVMVLVGGVQLAAIYLPWGNAGTVSLGRDLGVPLTILFTVLLINAINFIDGLDGLAAGVSAIAATAFFTFSYHLAATGNVDVAAAPTLLTAALAGMCVGFLPHNFSPARIFMGDSGSMLIGLILAAAATTATTNADAQSFGHLLGALPLYLPLLIPIAVLAIPFVDLTWAVSRRIRRGQSPFAPDKQHLHHRLLELGHTQRRAVVLLYFWSALLAFGGVALSITRAPWVVVAGLISLAVLGLVASAGPRVHLGRR